MKILYCIPLLLLMTACSVPKKPAESFMKKSIQNSLKSEIAWWDGNQPSEKVRQRVAKRLNEPLGAMGALEIALINSYDIQILLAELGEQHARSMQTTLLANPVLEAAFIDEEVGLRQDWELRWNIISLFTIASRQKAAESSFESSQLAALDKLYTQLYSVYESFMTLTAMKQKLSIEARSLESLRAAKLSTEELYRVGNTTAFALNAAKVDYLLSNIRYEQLIRDFKAKRYEFAAMLSVDPTKVTLPNTLPKVSDEPIDMEDIVFQAMSNNIKLKMLEKNIKAIESNQSVNDVESIAPDIEVGPVIDIENGHTAFGGVFEYTLPIFDTGSYQRAALSHRLRSFKLKRDLVKTQLQGQIKSAALNLDKSYEAIDTLVSDVTPLQIALETESMKSYNGMQMGVFELLAIYRQGNERRIGFVDMLLQYWIAKGQIEAMIIGITPNSMTINTTNNQSELNSKGGH